MGRIVALLAIAVAVAGLAHARSAHPAGWAAVPDGARAGQLELERCTYGTEKGDVEADCGTLVVPENRADPKSRLIALPVTRIRSSGSRRTGSTSPATRCPSASTTLTPPAAHWATSASTC